MSPSDANPVKSSSSPANTTQAAVLNWEVFGSTHAHPYPIRRMHSYEEKKITAPSRSIEV
jgi:hypothetical protein